MESISSFKELPSLGKGLLLPSQRPSIGSELLGPGVTQMGINVTLDPTVATELDTPATENGEQHNQINSLSNIPTSGGNNSNLFEQKVSVKERFIVKTHENTSANSDDVESIDESKEVTSDDIIALSDDELHNLKQCRNRAYGKVNQKKRMHLNASLSQYILKEWLSVYPNSLLTGKQLVSAFESNVSTEDTRKTPRGRKRKVSYSPTPPPEKQAKKNKYKSVENEALKDEEAEPDAMDTVIANSDTLISCSTHSDRQWTEAMLSNLMYCNQQALDKLTDLESEWHLLYPNSALTARNLKSRLTVYQRTHCERSAPTKPMQEKEASHLANRSLNRSRSLLVQDETSPPPPTIARAVSDSVPVKKRKSSIESTKSNKIKAPISWTSEMVTDMFETLDIAREELDSTVNSVVNKRWHQLWLERHPSCSQVTRDNLYSRYLYHAKKASRVYTCKEQPKSPTKENSNSSGLEVNTNGVRIEDTSNKEVVEKVVENESNTETSKVGWTDEKMLELWKAKIFVEDRLRCIQDDYFYELLHERWSNQNPESKDSPEGLRAVLDLFESNKDKMEAALKIAADEKPIVESIVKEEELVNEKPLELNGIKEEDIKEEPMIEDEINEDDDDDSAYECKEEPVEFPSVPRSKWVCPNHYIHVFYDDQDKSVECILTDQLLQMRNALAAKFPGQDLTKSGKKPPGFARLLLAEWTRHYPGSQENTKTISMKIGRYDRAPTLLQQEAKGANGRINWTPAMLENIRTTREKAVEVVGANGGPNLTKQWRMEWEELYPDLKVDWKQVISRYHYHYGGERRDSVEGERSGRSSVERTPSAPPSVGNSDTEEGEGAEDIRGFRQWTSSMQEDLLILRDILTQADPGLDPASKLFSRQLLSLFQDKHPHCMESARSLLSKLKDPPPQVSSLPALETVKIEPEEASPSPPPKPKTPKTNVAKQNPAVEIMSDIEGFTDWNLGMVRDFISCMDRARRKYADMKEIDPQMKLVPLLLSEWKSMYPQSEETVKTFLVRIRFLKTNKECIKARLGQHDLLPRMSQEETNPPSTNTAPAPVEDEKDEVQEVTEEGTPVKFVWDANTMMPIVIATRAKAIAKQKREAAQGRRVSYAKIWIKEFKKIYPSCPYTANNLSVHYWYWTSKDTNQEKKDNTIKPPEIVEVEPDDTTADWSEDQLNELKRVGAKVDAMLKDASTTNTKTMEFTKLLHSVWIKLHPQSKQTEKSLSGVLSHVLENKENIRNEVKEVSKPAAVAEKWTPRHNKAIREIVQNLKLRKMYTRNNVMKEWRVFSPRMDWRVLRGRIDDCCLPLPPNIIDVREAKAAPVVEEIKAEPKPAEADPVPSGLNARGQMRWTQQAVSDLLECHKLGLEAKNGSPDRKLADLVHQKFKQRHPYCPIAPNVLLTKCYILRSELKSGKLVLTDCKEDTGEKYRGEAGLRTWTMPMLEELVASRKRAIGRRKIGGQGGSVGQVLGEVWLQEFQKVYPDYRSSKKNLFRKYKWWKQKRAEAGKTGGTRTGKRILVEEDGELFKEIAKGLAENTVKLPPFVSSKVIMLAQQWVENSQAMEDMEQEEGEIEKEMDGEEEAPGMGMITLPGGAVLVAKTGPGESNKGRLTEPPDVSITLSQKSAQAAEPGSSGQGVSITLCSKGKQDWPAVPSALVTILTNLSLPLALVPTLLAVYRDVRDTYKMLVQQGYVVSWAKLLTVRLKTAWPGTAVTPTTMEQLVLVTLQEAGQAMQPKIVSRPGPVVECTVELLQNLQDHMERWGEVLVGWQHWQGEKVSARQFVSLVELICPGETFNCDELSCQAELCEVWSRLGEKGETALPDIREKRVVRRMARKPRGTTMSLDVVGRWLGRVKHIKSGAKRIGRRPRLVQKNPRLFWSLERVELLKRARERGVGKWIVGKRRLRSVGEMVVLEFRKVMGEVGKRVRDKQILGKLVQIQRREMISLGMQEDKAWGQLVKEYTEYLGNVDDIETVENRDGNEAAIKHHSEDGMPDYDRDEDVIEFIREKEGGRKVANMVWSSSSLSILLKAREIARLRRTDWESWAVSKHGTLHAAYSNPRVRVPKVEELLVEEWGRLRPNQAGISAWTLNSHLKKFDNLKRQLLDEQLEERRLREARAAPPAQVVCHHNTSIPIYNLSQLSSCSKLPSSVRLMVATRQRAMQREDLDRQLNYLELWSLQWEMETGEQVEGIELQNRLHQMQARPSVRHRLKQVMVTQIEDKEVEEGKFKEEIDLDRFEFEVPAVGYRNTVFPRVAEQALDILVRRKVEADASEDDDKETWLETLGHSRLGLPIVTGVKEIVNEEGMKYKPKVTYLTPRQGIMTIQGDSSQEGLHCCPHPLCSAQFQNYNNFLFHLSVHKNTAGLGGHEETFGHKMAAHRLCRELVMECLEKLDDD